MDKHAIRTAVRERYARAATRGNSCCEETASPDVPTAAPKAPSCCGEAPVAFIDGRAVPEDIGGASLGCGAPLEAAAIQPGETVVDLGSGAGLDVFLAADRAGPTGRAVGVDMTPEMIARARQNAARLSLQNVEFRLGEIEHLPLPDDAADVIISNCVINLLPDKQPAFAEAFRVLRAGGRMVISDIVSGGPLPDAFKTSETWAACLAGAIPQDEYLGLIAAAGFADITVVSKKQYAAFDLYSVTVRATKPATP